MTISLFFDIYLDAQFVLLLAACTWLLLSTFLIGSPFRYAFLLKLRLLYSVLITVAVMPLVIILMGQAIQSGVISSAHAPSLADIAVAQYLNGQIEMSASRFESLLMMRTDFTQNVTGLETPLAVGAAAALVLGTLFFAVALIRNGLHVSRLIACSYLWRRAGRIEIRITDQTHIPFSTRGVRQHYIVVPSTLLAHDDDLRIAVAHELQHMRQGDLIWEIALEFLRPLFFWNPGFWLLKREVEKLRELACDQQVLERQRCSVKDYCDCLLRVCHNGLNQSSFRPILVPTVPLVQMASAGSGKSSTTFLKYRVTSMFSKARIRPGKLGTAFLVLPAIAAISFGSVAAQQKSDWSQDRLMLSTIVNLERLDQRNQSRK